MHASGQILSQSGLTPLRYYDFYLKDIGPSPCGAQHRQLFRITAATSLKPILVTVQPLKKKTLKLPISLKEPRLFEFRRANGITEVLTCSVRKGPAPAAERRPQERYADSAPARGLSGR